MPPLPIIPGTFRISLIGNTDGGITPVNVFHISTASDNVAEIAEALIAAMDVPILLPMHANFNPVRLDILPLDGATPTASFPIEITLAAGTGEYIPEAACVVSLRTSARGPHARGRMFIGPLSENTTNGGFIVESVVNDLTDNWGEWVTNMGTGDVPMGLVVASYVDEVARIVMGFTVRSGQATQRRRLLQQR